MSWQTEIVEQVRVIINDIDEPQTYSDSRIERVCIIGAVQVLREIDFSSTYTINISTQTISPDPSEISTKDNDFMHLVSLKVACLILTGECRKYALCGVSVDDGPSSIDMKGIYKNLKDLQDSIQRQYDKAKILMQSGGNGGVGRAVTTPTTVENLYPIQDF